MSDQIIVAIISAGGAVIIGLAAIASNTFWVARSLDKLEKGIEKLEKRLETVEGTVATYALDLATLKGKFDR